MFSLFKGTRVLLRIVIEIMKDMFYFMVFVLMTTLTLSLLYTAATPDDSLTNLTSTDYLMHVYRLDFGDFSPDDYSPLDTTIFIVAVIIVPLVLFNMLIAIMGDTFDRVKEESGRMDFQEMASLIYRYEIIAQSLCKGNRGQVWKYMSQDVKYSGDEAIDVWQGRIKLVIERSQKKQEEWHNQTKKWLSENKERIDEIEHAIKRANEESKRVNEENNRAIAENKKAID